jgi:periplasmic copper chaperone A
VARAEVTAANAWVRGTAPGQLMSAAYLTLTSTDDAKVVDVSSPVAKKSQIHASMMMSGIMHMHAIDGLALPARQAVELKPGGNHVMLMDLAKPLRAGEQVPLLFTIQDAKGRRSTLEVKALVRPLVP